jgi:hypothetical protein
MSSNDLTVLRDLAKQLGVLFWRMHRCARVLVDTGLMGEREFHDAVLDAKGNTQGAVWKLKLLDKKISD